MNRDQAGSSGLVVPSKVDNIDGAKKSGFDVFCLIDCKLSTAATCVAYIKILGLAIPRQISNTPTTLAPLCSPSLHSLIQQTRRVVHNVRLFISILGVAIRDTRNGQHASDTKFCAL